MSGAIPPLPQYVFVVEFYCPYEQDLKEKF
jgi:hypothetical protein